MNIETMKQWAKKSKSLALTVCKARALAEVESDRVASYVDPLFDKFNFEDQHGKAIKERAQLYLCRDENLCAEFYTACTAAHKANGFTGKDGYCPALIADGLAIEAESALLLSLGEFAGVGNRFNCSSRKIRDNSLSLALTLCVNA